MCRILASRPPRERISLDVSRVKVRPATLGHAGMNCRCGCQRHEARQPSVSIQCYDQLIPDRVLLGRIPSSNVQIIRIAGATSHRNVTCVTLSSDSQQQRPGVNLSSDGRHNSSGSSVTLCSDGDACSTLTSVSDNSGDSGVTLSSDGGQSTTCVTLSSDGSRSSTSGPRYHSTATTRPAKYRDKQQTSLSNTRQAHNNNG